MKYYFDIQQNTPEWLAIRMGKFTSSMFADLFMAKSTAGYKNAINRVVFERLTGEVPESFSNKATDRGHELEPIAREDYELRTFRKVKEVGFVEMNEWIGTSPDGLIGENGSVQIKCPFGGTLIDYYLKDEIPSEYMYQMQGELLVTEREWVDYYCYHPKLKPILKRVSRDEVMIANIKAKLEESINEAEKRITQIKKG